VPLIFAVNLHGGGFFLDRAMRRQALDVQAFFDPTPGFWSPRATELDLQIRKLAERLAAGLDAAPVFRGDFPVVDPSRVVPDKAPALPAI
jgi:hypothetical protein